MRELLAPLLLLAAGCAPTHAPPEELATARQVAMEGRLDEARVLLAELAATYPEDAEVALVAGEVASWRGYPEDSLRWFRAAAEVAPNDPEPHLRLAYVFLIHPPDGTPDAAAALFEAEQALADAGGTESADYCACRGEAAWAAGDEQEAERWFRRALDLRADCRWALQRLLQITAGHGEEAERAVLNERLSALIREAAAGGHGMENARMPVSFCGH